MLTLLAERHVIALDSSDGSGGGGAQGRRGGGEIKRSARWIGSQCSRKEI